MASTPRTPAPARPVARVLPLLRVAHLDREFDYLVDTQQDADCQPGVIVRVRFSGQLTDAVVLERRESSEHQGRLAWLERVVSKEVVASASFMRFVETLANRYGGLRSDIIRAAIPPRHAAAEAAAAKSAERWEELGPALEQTTGYQEALAATEGPGDAEQGAGTAEREASAAECGAGAVAQNARAAESRGRVAEQHGAEAERSAEGQRPDALHPGLLPEGAWRGWLSYRHASSFLRAVREGRAPRAVWQLAPGEAWADRLAELAAETAHGGGGVLIIVPDQRQCDCLARALERWMGAKQVVVLTASLGRHARYRRFIDILHGTARVVIGTRSAAFAQVRKLQLIAIVDDGNDNLVDHRAPYVHARDILTQRASQEKAAMIIAGYSRTAEAQLLVESGWAHGLVADRDTIRERMPRIRAIGDSDAQLARDPGARRARIPAIAFEAIRAAQQADKPAIIQVPRKGYVPTLACRHCGASARCRYCHGPLGLPDSADGQAHLPTCRWCGREDPAFRCQECGRTGLRAVVIGASRTAAELGRAFPGLPVTISSGDHIVDAIPAGARLVVATPGAAPTQLEVPYGAAVFLDTWAQLNREDVRAHEETLNSWLTVAAHVDSHTNNGQVVVVADSSFPLVQSFIRWDAVGAAAHELRTREEAGFPPAVHMAALDGTEADITVFRRYVEPPEGTQALGPVPLPPGVAPPPGYPSDVECQRLLLRTPAAAGPTALGAALRAARVKAGLAHEDVPVRVIVDPIHIG